MLGSARLDLETVKERLAARGWSLANLARRLQDQGWDGTVRTVQNVVEGRTAEPSLAICDHIARALGVRLDRITVRD